MAKPSRAQAQAMRMIERHGDPTVGISGMSPKRWNPKAIGEELIGYYGGKSVRNGSFGQYEVVLVHVPLYGAFMISGVRICQLIDTSCISPGTPVRVVWRGEVKTGAGNDMKDFDLMVAEGEAIAATDLPSVTQ